MKRFAPEALLLGLIFVAAAWWGAYYTRASLAAGRQPAFYQDYFEPAVMLACGRGFVRTVGGPPPSLHAFLHRKTDTFSCGELPADLNTTREGVFQYAWFYLMASVALTWMLVGVSWSGLTPLFATLFAVAVACVYAISRFGMGRTLAACCAFATAVSTVHLGNLLHLRDYAKAPFVLASIVVLAWLVTRQVSWRTTPLLAALYGAILGVGYGFRTDLLAGLPVLLIVLFVFTTGGLLKNIPIKIAAAVAFAITFLAVAWPAVNFVVSRGGCQWHVVLLGFAPEFDSVLGVSTPAVQWGTTYSDNYVAAMIGAYADRTMPEVGRLEFCWPDYDRASGRYLRDVAFAAPADMLTRAYSSTLRITDLPFRWYSTPLEGLAPWLYLPRAVVTRALVGYGWIPVAITIGIIGAWKLRLGLFLAVFLLYFGGYPSLQFANRHYFHLEFMTWWAMGFLLQRALDAFKGRVATAELPRSTAAWAGRVVLTAVVVGGLVGVPLWLARSYQDAHARRMIHRFLGSPRTPIPLAADTDGAAMVPAAPSAYPSPDPRELQYVDVELDPQVCGLEAVVSLKYAKALPDLGHVIAARIGDAPARHIIAPAFWHFRGVAVSQAPPECLKSITRLAVPAEVAAFPTFVLPDHWSALPLHQEIRR